MVLGPLPAEIYAVFETPNCQCRTVGSKQRNYYIMPNKEEAPKNNGMIEKKAPSASVEWIKNAKWLQRSDFWFYGLTGAVFGFGLEGYKSRLGAAS